LKARPLALTLLFSCTPAFAQTLPDDIIVTASRGESRVQSPSLIIDGAAIDERAPVAAADLFRSIAGLSLRVNSRGESVVRVRGSEERQTTVFLDGAPLATPWDGRVDLALLPAGLIGRVSVIKGAAPIEYGANAVAGVVDLQTLIASDRATVRGEGQVGTFGLVSTSAIVAAPLGGHFSIISGGSYTRRNAERIAKRSSVPFDLSQDERRTNTDFDGSSGFGAVGYEGDDLQVRLSLLHADVERGIAAQGDLDPATASPRYWRYPRWSLDQLTITGKYRFSSIASLRVAGWRQWFGQTIHAYRDASYSSLRSQERGDDRTSGARATLTSDWGASALRLSATAQTSTHIQTDATTAGLASDFVDGNTLRYRQNLYSVGGEFDQRLSPSIDATIGIGIDRAETPLTGDKPAQRANDAMSFHAAARWEASPNVKLSASLGRRSRFPSPRELFGESLGRFLSNSDLAPEKALLGDVSMHWSVSPALSVDANLWASDTDGTISQRVVRVGSVNRRQRYNMAGNFAYGLEASVNAKLTPKLSAELGIALQHGRAKAEANGIRPTLFQRPTHQITAALDWSPVPAIDLRAEVQRGGAALDLSDGGSTVRLPGYASLNLRAFTTIATIRGVGPLALFAAADNLTDALILPQLGLPSPGRSLRVGIRIGSR